MIDSSSLLSSELASAPNSPSESLLISRGSYLADDVNGLSALVLAVFDLVALVLEPVPLVKRR
jgi:hypothetical protein